MFNSIETTIIEAMARTLWGSAWADYQEQVLGRPPRGEILDLAPDTPLEVTLAAYYFAGQLKQANSRNMHFLLRDAFAADLKRPITEHDVLSDEYAREFGSDLAMMLIGSGVSWFDDHEKFELRMPLVEWNYMCLSQSLTPWAELAHAKAQAKAQANPGRYAVEAGGEVDLVDILLPMLCEKAKRLNWADRPHFVFVPSKSGQDLLLYPLLGDDYAAIRRFEKHQRKDVRTQLIDDIPDFEIFCQNLLDTKPWYCIGRLDEIAKQFSDMHGVLESAVLDSLVEWGRDTEMGISMGWSTNGA